VVSTRAAFLTISLTTAPAIEPPFRTTMGSRCQRGGLEQVVGTRVAGIGVVGSRMMCNCRESINLMYDDTGAVTDRPEPDYLQPPVPADGPIFLADPDPGVAGAVRREEERVRGALGPGCCPPNRRRVPPPAPDRGDSRPTRRQGFRSGWAERTPFLTNPISSAISRALRTRARARSGR
jgi:hypothetical protein